MWQIFMLEKFLYKFFDKFLSTSKNILLIKNQLVASSIVDALAFIIVIQVTKKMVSASTMQDYLIFALAVFFGNIFSGFALKKFDKDKEWLHMVQFNNRKDGKECLDNIRRQNINVISFNSYNDVLENTISAYIKTINKNEARIVSDILKDINHKEITITNIKNMG